MKKIVFIIPPKDFRDVELLGPIDILKNAGISITIASKIAGLIVGTDGAKVQANKISDVNFADYDAVVFVGGPGTVPLIGDSELIKLAQDFYHTNRIIAAICAASAILANAGVLTDKNATSWIGVKKILTDHGANWQDTPIAVDGQLITAQGPNAANQFGQALLDAFKHKKLLP